MTRVTFYNGSTLIAIEYPCLLEWLVACLTWPWKGALVAFDRSWTSFLFMVWILLRIWSCWTFKWSTNNYITFNLIKNNKRIFYGTSLKLPLIPFYLNPFDYTWLSLKSQRLPLTMRREQTSKDQKLVLHCWSIIFF